MVVSEELIEEVDGFIGHESLVLRCDEAVPWLLLESSQDVIVLSVELDLVFVEVIEEIVGTQHLRNLNKLIRVAATVEEGLLPEDHGGEHGTKTPHIQTVVVFLEVDKELWTLEIA